MAPAKFGDLGKEAKDLINKNFHFGVIKFEGKTKTQNGVEFTTEGSHYTDTGNVNGSLETKFKNAEYGVTFTEKWTTENLISTNISIDDKIAKGLKVDFDTTFAPITGKKTAKVKTAYKHENVHATGDVDLNFAGPSINGSAVFAYKGWHAGYQASYDTGSSKLTANNASLTYKDGDFVVHSAINDGSKYVGSIHHQVNKQLSAAAMLQWASGSKDPASLTVCGRYDIDDETFMKAKLDNQLHLGISYVQNLRPGVQLTMSSLINAKSLENGGHKLGLSLNLSA